MSYNPSNFTNANPQLREGEVIAYLPPHLAQSSPAPSQVYEYYTGYGTQEPGGPADSYAMGRFGRLIYTYTHQLGLNFSLVLALALGFQFFVAVFIGLNGLKALTWFQSQDTSSPWMNVLVNVLAVALAVLIQGLIIAEMAQVVWLRHPDKLKVRLMSGSIWWWVMLAALIVTSSVDFLLLFLSITGQTSLAAAWQSVTQNQLTGLANFLLALLNFLTLLRCAAVMRTSTREEIHREVEEQLAAIAEEILLDAGDQVRAKAAAVWEKLAVNPRRMIPLFNSVLNLISHQHPGLVPPTSALGGDSWAYDFTSNTFAALPPDVHQALLQNRERVRRATTGQRRIETNDDELPWRLDPPEVAELVSYNLQSCGQPRFVDITDPARPRYLSRPVEARALGLDFDFDGIGAKGSARQSEGPAPAALAPAPVAGAGVTTAAPAHSPSPAALPPAFLTGISPTDKALFGAYLTNTVFPSLHGCPFPHMPEIGIFDVFDEVDLRYYWRHWKNTPPPSMPAQAPVPGYAPPAPMAPFPPGHLPYGNGNYSAPAPNNGYSGYNYYYAAPPTQPQPQPPATGGYGYGYGDPASDWR
jgi:hypothetical protein